MEQLSFTAFKELCEFNQEKKYVQELLEVINNSDCHFFPGGVMPQEEMASLYSLRLSIDKDYGSKDEIYLYDYEKTVFNMGKSQSEKLGLVWLKSELFSYLVFYEPVPPVIMGILKVRSKSTLDSAEQLNNEREEQGYTSGFEKYSKGRLIKAWK